MSTSARAPGSRTSWGPAATRRKKANRGRVGGSPGGHGGARSPRGSALAALGEVLRQDPIERPAIRVGVPLGGPLARGRLLARLRLRGGARAAGRLGPGAVEERRGAPRRAPAIGERAAAERDEGPDRPDRRARERELHREADHGSRVPRGRAGGEFPARPPRRADARAAAHGSAASAAASPAASSTKVEAPAAATSARRPSPQVTATIRTPAARAVSASTRLSPTSTVSAGVAPARAASSSRPVGSGLRGASSPPTTAKN